MPRVLLTGCAGFIGWKVAELLLAEGYTVVGIDNLNDAYDVRLKEWRLQRLRSHSGFAFKRLDITDQKALYELFLDAAERPFSAVLNLAARAGVRQSVQNPWIYYETNVTGTLNLLELCRSFGVKKFLLASTSSLYGNRNSRPFREDAPTDHPPSPYAASKKAAETLCYTYHYIHGLDVIVLRYFTVYGPAGRPDMSIFRFVRWIAEGESIFLYGDGTQERDFTYVDDIARGTFTALRYLVEQSPGFEVINLGSDRPVALNYAITILEELIGRRVVREERPGHPADVPATWADITRARQMLGWTPEVDLEEGLRRTVDWYMENRDWVREVVLP